jgi:hypothetical protein
MLNLAPKGCVVLTLSNKDFREHLCSGGFQQAFIASNGANELGRLIPRSDVSTIEVYASKLTLNTTVTDSN